MGRLDRESAVRDFTPSALNWLKSAGTGQYRV
jgi:hypothetical protein